jgi:uncharacterized membrane protein
MKIISNSDGMYQAEYNLQYMYDILTNEFFTMNEEVRNEKELQHIIAWLPLIDSILVVRTMRDDWLDILFSNGDRIKMYNTGLEYAFDMLVDE